MIDDAGNEVMDLVHSVVKMGGSEWIIVRVEWHVFVTRPEIVIVMRPWSEGAAHMGGPDDDVGVTIGTFLATARLVLD